MEERTKMRPAGVKEKEPRLTKWNMDRMEAEAVHELAAECERTAASTPSDQAIHELVRRRVMSELGRMGGLKGGPATAAKLTPEQRSEKAKKMVQARWARVPRVDPEAKKARRRQRHAQKAEALRAAGLLRKKGRPIGSTKAAKAAKAG
jgi:hypothetical protein